MIEKERHHHRKKIEYVIGNNELFPKLKDLRIQLLVHHRTLDHRFQSDFDAMIKKFSKPEEDNIKKEGSTRVALAKDADNSEIIGYCYGKIYDNKTGEIISLYVKPEYQGHQIGSVLTQHIMEWFKKEGIKEISLYVCKGNKSVYKFYEKFGFFPRKMLLKHLSTDKN